MVSVDFVVVANAVLWPAFAVIDLVCCQSTSRTFGFAEDDTLDLSNLGLAESDFLLQQVGGAWHVIAPGHGFTVIVVMPQLSRAQVLI